MKDKQYSNPTNGTIASNPQQGGTISLSGTDSITGAISPSPTNTISGANIVTNNTSGTVTFSGQDVYIDKITGKITVAPNTNYTLNTLGYAEELVLGAHSTVKVSDLNNMIFKNEGNEVKTILLSGENITSDSDNTYA